MDVDANFTKLFAFRDAILKLFPGGVIPDPEARDRPPGEGGEDRPASLQEAILEAVQRQNDTIMMVREDLAAFKERAAPLLLWIEGQKLEAEKSGLPDDEHKTAVEVVIEKPAEPPVEETAAVEQSVEQAAEVKTEE